MRASINIENMIGAIIAVFNNVLLIFIFAARLRKMENLEHFLGIILIISIIPLTYLLISALQVQYPYIYYLQLSLMIIFVIVELLLDYNFKSDFRSNNIYLILYITLFFGATGGMIGVAGHAGKFWLVTAAATFILMTLTAFYMHYKTGE